MAQPSEIDAQTNVRNTSETIPAQPLLLDLAIESLPCHKVGNVVIVIFSLLVSVLSALLLLHALIAFCQLAQRSETVRPKLVQDTGDEFGQFFVLAIAVYCEGVRGHRGMN